MAKPDPARKAAASRPQSTTSSSAAAANLPADFKASILSSFEKFERIKSRTAPAAPDASVPPIEDNLKTDIKSSIDKFNEILNKNPSRPLPAYYQRHYPKLYQPYFELQRAQQRNADQAKLAGEKPEGPNFVQPNMALKGVAGAQPGPRSMSKSLSQENSAKALSSPNRRSSQLQFLTETLTSLRPFSEKQGTSPAESGAGSPAAEAKSRWIKAETPESKAQAASRPSQATNGAKQNQAQALGKGALAPKERGASPARERGQPEGKQITALRSMPLRSASDNALFPLKPSPTGSSAVSRTGSPAAEDKVSTEPSFELDGKTYTPEDAKKLPLRYPWTLYYDSRTNAPKHVLGRKENYESNLQTIFTFQDVYGFCGVMNNVKRPGQLEVNSNLHLFKNGIKPMWEDPANMRGGKWTFTFSTKHASTRPEFCDRTWLNLAMALVGDQLSEDVCGIVVSRRNRGNRIAVWIPNALDNQKIETLREEILKFADTGGENLPLDFASHEASLASTPK